MLDRIDALLVETFSPERYPSRKVKVMYARAPRGRWLNVSGRYHGCSLYLSKAEKRSAPLSLERWWKDGWTLAATAAGARVRVTWPSPSVVVRRAYGRWLRDRHAAY